MNNFEHQSIQELCAHQFTNPIETLHNQIAFLANAVEHLQNHCTHLEEVLRANNITLPVKEKP